MRCVMRLISPVISSADVALTGRTLAGESREGRKDADDI